jgi:hypothetical protein
MEGWPVVLLLLCAGLLLVLLRLPLLPLHLPAEQALIKALASACSQYPGILPLCTIRSGKRI